jgi:acyl-coenzyme A synthetase/AMP-(fatty) acid ligase
VSEIVATFLDHAARAPGRIAVRVRRPDGGFSQTTRGELATEVREAIRMLDTTPNRPPILSFAGPRDEAAVVHLLATLAAGRGFSFLDPRLPPVAAAVLEMRLISAPGRIADQSVAACLFTSGSTGVPKGVLVGRDDLDARAQAEAEWFGVSEDDILLGLLPLSFDVGLNQLCTALVTGAQIVFLDSLMPGDLLDTTRDLGITGISAVPMIWRQMLRLGGRFDVARDHSSLRYVTISGGDLAPSELARMEELAGGAGVFKTYGQTETFRSASLRPEEFRDRPQSVGRAFPGARFGVVRPDGTACAPAEEGEVAHAGLGVSLGYLDGEKRHRSGQPTCFSLSIDGGGPTGENGSTPAVLTGDRAVVDDAGYLFLRGRTDAMQKIGGTRIYPREIAERILASPLVADVEVVPAGERDGEPRLAAFLVAADGARPTPAETRRAMAAVLPRFLIPASCIWLDRIPRTMNGKTDLKSLEEMAADR